MCEGARSGFGGGKLVEAGGQSFVVDVDQVRGRGDRERDEGGYFISEAG